MKVAALAGGVGGAKLLVGLQRALSNELTAIVNTADDATIYGVRVSPDVDIVTYWLAGMADTARGWGLAHDSFEVVDALERLGAPAWFRLGDRDLATCIYRSERLADGAALSTVTDEIRRALGVPARILPMSDDPVATHVIARDGRVLGFQEYFVKERTEPDIVEVQARGSEDAKPAPGVLDALGDAERVVVCPSNPVVSIGPILAMPGVREALRAHPDVVAVTPIVRGAALKGPADRLLASLGHGSTAAAVARMYADFCDVFVIDASDESEVDPARRAGVAVALLDTIMVDHAASERLARALLTLPRRERTSNGSPR